MEFARDSVFAFARAAALVLAAALAGPSSAGADAVEATALRAAEHPDYTRLVLEMSGGAEFAMFGLTGPDRLVIDFPDLGFRLPRRPLGGEGAGIVGGVRFGRFRPGTSRMVLDLNGPARVERAFFISPENGGATRFVLDLAETTPGEFAAWASESQRGAEPAPPAPPPPAPTARPDGPPTVVVDPGHGGIDPGASGRGGTQEKDIALAAGRDLARRLAEGGRYRVAMTRDADVFVALRRRVAIARDAGADLFLSIHADSIDDSRVRGSHVYTLSQRASDAEAEALAAKENKSDIVAGLDMASYSPDVNLILLDLSQRETNNRSADLANAMVDAFARRGVRSVRRPHRQAGFAVLKAPDVPSVLVELGFLSNPADENALQTARGREPIIAAIVEAVGRYFEDLRAEPG